MSTLLLSDKSFYPPFGSSLYKDDENNYYEYKMEVDNHIDTSLVMFITISETVVNGTIATLFRTSGKHHSGLFHGSLSSFSVLC